MIFTQFLKLIDHLEEHVLETNSAGNFAYGPIECLLLLEIHGLISVLV